MKKRTNTQRQTTRQTTSFMAYLHFLLCLTLLFSKSPCDRFSLFLELSLECCCPFCGETLCLDAR